MRKLGFTLAEVLITLTIIGIIAAVTLPALRTNVDKQALSTQVAKMYSQIDSGFRNYRVDESVSNNVGMHAKNFAKKYLEVAYVCKDRDDAKCFASEYDSINNNTVVKRKELYEYCKFDDKYGSFILKDGSVIEICTEHVTFDVNGKKGPNKIGYDLHMLSINGDSNPIGYSHSYIFGGRFDEIVERDFDRCKNGTNPYGCLTRLQMNNFKFDY